MKLNKISKLFISLDILFLIVLVLVLFPLKSIILNKYISNNVLVNSLYNNNDVIKVVSDKTNLKINNKYEKDVNLIEQKKNIMNEYDIQILTPEENNDDYKVINLEIGGYEAFLAVIYDPTKVQVVSKEQLGTTYGETLIKMCNRYNGSICINGGYFVDNGYGSGIPIGYVIENGIIRWSNGDPNKAKGNIIGITEDGKLKLLSSTTGTEALESGVVNGIEFGPFLIVDGVSQDVAYYVVGGYKGAARAAIAQRRDGIMLFLVTNGSHGKGVTMGQLIDALEKYGAYNAANLDGGLSTSLTVDGNLVNTPRNIYGEVINGGRTLVDGFGFIK